MTIIRQVRVGSVMYRQVGNYTYDSKLRRYVITVIRGNGEEQQAYANQPAGPYVFATMEQPK